MAEEANKRRRLLSCGALLGLALTLLLPLLSPPPTGLVHADSLAFGSPSTRLQGECARPFAELAEVHSVASDSATVFFDYGCFAVWFDPATRVSALTVHRLEEHEWRNESRAMHWKCETRLPKYVQAHTDDYLTTAHTPLGPFDRGHLVPHADMFDVEAEVATYVMTNAAPQLESLNRGAWKLMEAEIRELVECLSPSDEDGALVFTGPLYDPEISPEWIPLDPSTSPQVRVPNGFFKLVCFLDPDDTIVSVRMWVWRQEYVDNYVEASAWRDLELTDLEALERATGIRFFP